jgi:cytochrome c nitrite reductase small subunit
MGISTDQEKGFPRRVGMFAGVVTIVAAAAAGVALGLGGFTFVYARGASYLGNDPGACANCHVMRPQLEGWVKSSHRHVASCNDCHTPPGTVAKYGTKALNGFFHSLAFTTGRFPEPIRITERNRRVTESACRGCHGAVVDAIESAPVGSAHRAWVQTSCLACHPGVGHAQNVALGSVDSVFQGFPSNLPKAIR